MNFLWISIPEKKENLNESLFPVNAKKKKYKEHKTTFAFSDVN